MHSFFNHPRTPVEAAAAKDAWQRMLLFFGEYLG
jgi:dienelactone hydrolase